MFTLYTPGDLIGVVQAVDNKPITFIRDRFFPKEQQSDAEVIMFDVVDRKRRLAPYVSPLVRGKLVESRGYSTRAFKPAYVKPKSEINPNAQFRRKAGEPITAPMSPMQRRDAHIKECLVDHEEMCDMREEVQCVEALRLGQVTITGEGYGTVVVQFGRHADLTVTLTGAARWSEAGVKPLDNIRTWAKAVRENGGGVVKDVILDDDAYTALLTALTAEEKTMLFNSLRGSQSSAEMGPRGVEKVRFEGTIGAFNFWTYGDTYQDEDGNEQQVMPSGQVILVSDAIDGTRCYGAIRDARAGIQPIRRFPKMWAEEDPSTEWLMTQSAPLMVPTLPNASFGARVL